MDSEPVRLVQEYEFAPIIVWDALLDADLVSGWLAEATITPEIRGEYNLVWQHPQLAETTYGRITVLQPLRRLHVDTNDSGRLEFVLDELEGGFRGTGTRLALTIDGDIDDLDPTQLRVDWMMRLAQLDELLRGRPVDWNHPRA